MIFASPTPATLVPLYRQVSNDLAQAILRGTIAAGAPVPTEEALCTHYGVSRITIRKALDELAERQLVVRRRGVGTFAAGSEGRAKLVALTGYIEDLLSPNHLAVIREAIVRPPAELREHAQFADDTRLHMFEGINYVADDAPLAHLRLYYPPEIGRKLSAKGLAGPLPPIKYVEQQASVQVHHADQIMIPAIASGQVARHLQLRSGTPVLRGLRVYYDSEGRPLEMFDAHYHPTHYRYAATLYPRAGSAAPVQNVPQRASPTRRP